MRRSFVVVLVLGLVAAPGCEKSQVPAPSQSTASSSSSVASMKGIALGVPPCRSDQTITSSHGRTTSCILATDFSLDGYACSAGKQIEIQPSGKLKGCSLRDPRALDDWSCQDGMTLYPSGRLRRCKVATPRRIEPGIDVRAGDWVTVYEGAGLKRLELAVGPNTIQGYPCKGYLNFFHESGQLKKCELADDTTIDGQRVSSRGPAGASVYVCFDTKGKRTDCSTLSGMTLD